jgi:hypothetical protein
MRMKTFVILAALVVILALGLGIRAMVIARSRPSPESFNRMTNTSPEDFQRFLDWLFSQTLTDVRAARGDMTATRAAWIRYFQHGLKAGMSLEELVGHLPELFRKVEYPTDEAHKVLAMLKALTLRDIGFEPKKAE